MTLARALPFLLGTSLLALLGCKEDPKGEPPAPTLTGAGLFTKGCPVAGGALARTLTVDAERPEGPNALSRPGDVLLANTRAAFVIQDPTAPRTYVYYGGMPIDAVAVDGCVQAGPERFEELAVVLGQLELTDFAGSTLRMFRGERVEVVSDGSDGGPAVVEVHGVDDVFHLIELELIKRSFLAGTPKALSRATGLDLTMRYTLPPESSVLTMELVLQGEGDPEGYLAGLLAFPGDTTPTVTWTSDTLSVGGVNLGVGAPWFAAASPDASWALANPGGTLAKTTISGVTALLDVTHLATPLRPTGGQPASMTWALSVGGSGTPSATSALVPMLPGAFPEGRDAQQDIIVRVLDPQGAAVSGARVIVEAATAGGDWREIDRAWTGVDGTVSATLAGAGLRVRVEAEDRDVSTPPCVITPQTRDCAFSATPWSTLDVQVDDGEGTLLPARVELLRDDGWRTTVWHAPGDGPVPMRPGSYTAHVSRGPTHQPETLRLELRAGANVLAASLPELVDTEGWVSIDTHVHAEPSADSTVLAPDRFRTAAAGGLDVMVSTDHEIIRDLRAGRTEAGLDAWVGYTLGSEITATLPEHVNAWPFPAGPADDPRGGFVEWYGNGLGGMYALARERGAQVVQLNHPRVNGECGILCVIDWDRETASPRVPDMDDLGLPPGTPSWSWDFDAMEVINGLRSPFLRADDPRRSGAFEDWLSFLNHGHRVTAVAVTDVHGGDLPGSPRTWLDVGEDDPAAVPEAALVDAMKGGRAVVSTGAFLRARVGGAGPGELARTENGTASLSLRVEALPGVDVQRVEVLIDCDEVLELPADDPHGVVKLDTELALPLTRDAYVVVVAYGDEPLPAGLLPLETSEVVPRAFTNAIYVDADGDGAWSAPGDKRCAGARTRGVPGLNP